MRHPIWIMAVVLGAAMGSAWATTYDDTPPTTQQLDDAMNLFTFCGEACKGPVLDTQKRLGKAREQIEKELDAMESDSNVRDCQNDSMIYRFFTTPCDDAQPVVERAERRALQAICDLGSAFVPLRERLPLAQKSLPTVLGRDSVAEIDQWIRFLIDASRGSENRIATYCEQNQKLPPYAQADAYDSRYRVNESLDRIRARLKWLRGETDGWLRERHVY